MLPCSRSGTYSRKLLPQSLCSPLSCQFSIPVLSETLMRATSLLPLLFLILGHLLLPIFATPVAPDAPLMRLRQWGAKEAVPTPAYLQTLSPMGKLDPTATPSATVATPAATPNTPSNDTTPGDDSGEPGQVSKAGTALSSVNAGVALASRESLLFTVAAGVIATSLMF
ncbi:hypothetical protein EI94DRAFT_1737553 [Lactarius quietus]|nr:hypothetical protein EI94DRAFT_1737553 [Lactarius quietus]